VIALLYICEGVLLDAVIWPVWRPATPSR